MRPWSTRGFSFIEMVVVLAIVALGAAVAIPSIEAGLDGREVRRAVRQRAASRDDCPRAAGRAGRERMRRLRIAPEENRIETDDHARSAVLTERAWIERIDGGWDVGGGMYDVAFFPNGSTSGAELVVVSRRDRSNIRLRLVLDPLVGAINVEEAG